METLIPHPKHRRGKTFHDERRVWQNTYIYTSQLGSPEYTCWAKAKVDTDVMPGSFDQPKFNLKQANLMPRFDRWTKAQLVDWLLKNTTLAEVQLKSHLKDGLVLIAARTWKDGNS